MLHDKYQCKAYLNPCLQIFLLLELVNLQFSPLRKVRDFSSLPTVQLLFVLGHHSILLQQSDKALIEFLDMLEELISERRY